MTPHIHFTNKSHQLFLQINSKSTVISRCGLVVKNGIFHHGSRHHNLSPRPLQQSPIWFVSNLVHYSLVSIQCQSVKVGLKNKSDHVSPTQNCPVLFIPIQNVDMGFLFSLKYKVCEGREFRLFTDVSLILRLVSGT